MVDLNTLLGSEVEKAERPKPIPVGTYRMMVGEHKFGKSSKKGTDFVEYELSFIEALSDVDTEALAEVEAQKALGSRTASTTFYLTENSMFMLKDFLLALGISVGGGRTFQDAIPEARGHVVDVYWKHSLGQSGRAYAEIDTFKAPETD